MVVGAPHTVAGSTLLGRLGTSVAESQRVTEPVIPQGLSGDPIDLVLVAGARPNFVKLAPLHHALDAYTTLRKIIVHTGQHYDDAMSDVFFRELRIPSPNIN